MIKNIIVTVASALLIAIGTMVYNNTISVKEIHGDIKAIRYKLCMMHTDNDFKSCK